MLGLGGASSQEERAKVKMSEMEQGRRAVGSGKPFTTVVVLAILTCIALFVWRFLL